MNKLTYMKLDCVLSAVNENELYLDFIPIFIKTWNKLYPTVDVKIILIAEKIPEKYLEYKNNLILFKPIQNVLTSFTSQIIRLFYPCILNYKNGVMITDIDMIPMNRTYYTEHIKNYDNNKFIYLRENICSEINQIAMCYNVAVPNVWKEIFQINSIENIIETITSIFCNNIIKEGQGNIGWSIDQEYLYNRIMSWNKGNFIRLNEKETKFNRLNRDTFRLSDNLKNNISNGIYSDYHCYRPMSKYHEINYEIFNVL